MPKGTRHPHHPAQVDPELQPYLRLLGAVYQQAILDARRGDKEAQTFLRETCPRLNIHAIEKALLRRHSVVL